MIAKLEVGMYSMLSFLYDRSCKYNILLVCMKSYPSYLWYGYNIAALLGDAFTCIAGRFSPLCRCWYMQLSRIGVYSLRTRVESGVATSIPCTNRPVPVATQST